MYKNTMFIIQLCTEVRNRNTVIITLTNLKLHTVMYLHTGVFLNKGRICITVWMRVLKKSALLYAE
jgi:hypothetical protein